MPQETENMATPRVKIDPFNPSKISFELWLSLLEANFSNFAITDESKKKNVLLVSVGTDIFAVLGNICAPDLPHTKSYSELLALLKAHYDVKPSYHRSLLAFQQRRKKGGESLKELYADLKCLAKDCDFGSNFDSRVRDQLFMALENEIYFANLVAENLDLKTMSSSQILERVLSLEKAYVSEKSCPIQKVKASCSGSLSKFVSCKHCGYSHDSIRCRFKNLSCNLCGRKGHLKQVCWHASKDFKGSERPKPFKESVNKEYEKKHKKKVKVVEKVESPSDSDDEKLLSVKKVNSVSKDEIKLSVNGNSVPFEVDTGAAVSTLNKDWAHKLGMSIDECNKNLSAYDDLKIDVLGKVSVDVCYNSFQVKQNFYVVGNHNSNLCGKDLMPKIGIYLSGIDSS